MGDALQISTMFPKFQMHVIVQEYILTNYDVNATIDGLLNKTDEIVDNRSSSSSMKVKNKSKKAPPSYDESIKLQGSSPSSSPKSDNKSTKKSKTDSTTNTTTNSSGINS